MDLYNPAYFSIISLISVLLCQCTSILITQRMEKLDMSMMQRCIYISQLTIFRNIYDNLMTCFIQLSFNFIFGPRNYMFILLMIFMQRYKSFIFTKKNIRQSITLHEWPWRNSHLNLILFLRILFFHASQKAITAWDTTLSCADFFSLLTPSITGSKIVSRACSMYKLCSVGSSENHHKYILNY